MSKLAYSPLKLNLIRKDDIRGDIVGATGTGFLWSVNSKGYLITNWHNFSGKNPITNENLTSSGFRPSYVGFALLQVSGVSAYETELGF